MKAWMVWQEDLGFVLCRADTREKARTFYPEYTSGDRDSYTATHANRAPWLDGPGPPRELSAEHSRCEGPYDDDGECVAHHQCWEGAYLDREKTLAKLGGT